MAGAARCVTCSGALTSGEPHVCKEAATLVDRAREPRPDDARCPVQPGDLLAGRYRIEEEVGAGGSGVVLRAFDTELELRVAVKVLSPIALDPELVARFKREIRITRAIDHPNVSRVYDLGEAGGVTFLTMRWIDGQPLHERLRTSALSSSELVRLATGLTAALAAAHRIGVVHRDVKPANVIISNSGEPVLVDFGIALELEPSSSSDRSDTPVANVAGTPPFMAPEQQHGQPVLSSDLWGLALTLACAATGVTTPPSSATRALRRLPGPWRRAVARCLDGRPERRPLDASALLGLVTDAVRFRRRAVWASCALFLAAAAALWAVPTRERAAARARPIVHVEPLRNDTADPSFDWLAYGGATLLAHELELAGQATISHGGPLRPRARVRGRIVRTAGGPVLSLELTAGDRVVARGRASARGASLLGETRAMARRFLAALGRPAPERPGRSTTDDPEAFAQWARAWDLLRAHESDLALRALEAAARRDPTFALAHMDRYVFLHAYRSGPESEIADALATALAAARRHADRLPGGRRELLEAMVEARTGSSPRRFAHLLAALRSRPADPGAYYMASFAAEADTPLRVELLREWARRLPADPEPHNQLGYVLAIVGDMDAAEHELREYIRLAPGEANPWDSLADLERMRNKLPEALEAYQRALEIDPDFPNSAAGTIETLIALEDLDGAEAALARHRAQIVPREHHNYRWVYAHAAVELLAGRRRQAEQRLAAIAAAPPSPGLGEVARGYGAILWALDGDRARALEWAEGVRVSSGPADLPRYVEALARHRRGEHAELARVAQAFATEVARHPITRGSTERRHVAFARLGLVEALVQGGALDTEAALPLIPRRSEAEGVLFLWELERARALARRGAWAQAARAFEALLQRRGMALTTPEAAHEWHACLAQAATASRASGDEDRARELETRLAHLSGSR